MGGSLAELIFLAGLFFKNKLTIINDLFKTFRQCRYWGQGHKAFMRKNTVRHEAQLF